MIQVRCCSLSREPTSNRTSRSPELPCTVAIACKSTVQQPTTPNSCTMWSVYKPACGNGSTTRVAQMMQQRREHKLVSPGGWASVPKAAVATAEGCGCSGLSFVHKRVHQHKPMQTIETHSAPIVSVAFTRRCLRSHAKGTADAQLVAMNQAGAVFVYALVNNDQGTAVAAPDSSSSGTTTTNCQQKNVADEATPALPPRLFVKAQPAGFATASTSASASLCFVR